MIKKLWITLVFGIAFLSSYSQKLNVTKLDSLFRAMDEKNVFMGSIAISKNGNLIYSNSIGKADIATNENLSFKTKYRIGSTTKTFTSALVFKAIENRKITLNQTIEEFFPTIENSEKITIEMLLKHRSGIADFLTADDFANGYTEAKSKEEMIAIISKLKSDFNPNSKAAYSNSNYYLLTVILEEIYNKSYQALLNEQIVKPLKLRDTYFGGKINLQNNECYSYHFSDKWEKDTEGDTSVPLGAGGIVSNPNDLTIFIKNLFKGEIITLESLKTMTQIQDKYGMGIFELPFYDKKGFMHRGSIDSFGSVLCYFPDENLAIAITSNGAIYDKKKVLIAALSNYFNKPYKIIFEPFKPNQEDLDKYVGDYMSLSYPRTIAITKNNTNILANFSDQSVLSIEPVEKNKFENLWEGSKIEFKPSTKEMIFEENGEKFIFSKK
ncbi:CubicO group peptidase (beta-lactamase class C family) [Pedobacter cryoconitis]|uniref:CubicO group peptidase (Beta-lactamase class C family) n=1 Tax=Pedobacter cryoconitis TaxID=188932 RepID=A0A7W8ZPH0_9SPHI|nr:serine hydrolase domain-containing protein [Pedobacter cryoconitis]MBB5637580.1 CubicO group peptidase (beta-lactamase class C family) [Pedobacter cryoconitis]MBB6270007.1 CubicO group peptidase (beta-lactamase class C family) [Pedobacter cryoconitis]